MAMAPPKVRPLAKCEHDRGTGRYCRRCGMKDPPAREFGSKPCWFHDWRHFQRTNIQYRHCQKCGLFQRHWGNWETANIEILAQHIAEARR